MPVHSDVWLAALFLEMWFLSKVPSVLRTEVPDLGPRLGRLILFQSNRNGWYKSVATPSQYVEPPAHDMFQRTLATGQQNYGNLALVAPAAIVADIAVRLKPIDQAHGTVVPNKQALCELSYGRFVLSRKCADRKKHLILLRFKAGPFGSSVATSKKLTDAMPQFS